MEQNADFSKGSFEEGVPCLKAALSEDPMPRVDYQLAQERQEKTEARTIKQHGYGDTIGALAIAEVHLPAVSKAFEEACGIANRGTPELADFKRVVAEIGYDVVALAALTRALEGAALEHARVTVAQAIGSALGDEAWAKELREHDKALAKATERYARKRSARSFRMLAARNIARRHGFDFKDWSTEFCVKLGGWALEVLSEATGIFTTAWKPAEDQYGSGMSYLSITPESLAVSEKAWAAAIRAHPVYLPTAAPPSDWIGCESGGTVPGVSFRPRLVRTRRKSTVAAVNEAIESGRMRPVLDAVNTIQRVPWTINRRVLSVMQECREKGLSIKGLPRAHPIPVPEHGLWEEMTEDARRLWKHRKEEIKQANGQRVSDHLLHDQDIATAEQLAELERFWTPCNLDWRGRVYALPTFNFQRSDTVRALFLFADGEPIGEEGLRWLKVHTANCGDFDKISKRPFEERVLWADQNAAVIREIAENPLADKPFAMWSKADKPFLFLSACLELATALTEGPAWTTRLPVSWDGSCSGLQHLCAMTRAPEGALVNLTPSESPQDVYQTVADKCAKAIKADAEEGNTFAAMCLAHGIDRKVVKRNVMTYSYSSGKFGMADQHRTDLMDPLRIKVLAGELPEHPFGGDSGYAASIYLAEKVHTAIEQAVDLPAQAMKTLQSIAKALAHEGKPVRWTTPTGLPWENRYHKPVTRPIRLWLHDRGVRKAYRPNVAVKEERALDRHKGANAIAPNFVHACDAAHLMLTVNAAKGEGINHFALVHDSFGCLASQSGRMHRIIREQFVKMYQEHDVLAEVLEQAKCDLLQRNWNTLPNLPQYGNLDLKELLNADYAFA